MKFSDALTDIQKKYEIKPITQDVCEIKKYIMLDDINRSVLTLKNLNGTAILTDYGTICDYTNLSDKEIIDICKKNNVKFREYVIECDYNNLLDIDKMLKTFEEIIQKNT